MRKSETPPQIYIFGADCGGGGGGGKNILATKEKQY